MTAHWFSEEEAREAKVLNCWDGMIWFPDRKQGRDPEDAGREPAGPLS